MKMTIFEEFWARRGGARGPPLITAFINAVSTFQETLKELFPSWDAVMRYREVILFTVGLLPDPQPLVDHVYEMWIQKELERMKETAKYAPEVDIDLFRSLYTESTVELRGVWNHNQHINHYGN